MQFTMIGLYRAYGVGIMEEKMEATMSQWGCIGVVEGIMEKKMETIIHFLFTP